MMLVRKIFVCAAEAVAGLMILLASACPGAVTYSYDALNRLTNVDYGNGSVISYSYDAAGNRRSYSGVVANDTIAPSIAIISPTTGLSYTNTSAIINLSGTSSDNVGVTLVTWANYSDGTIGTAIGTTSWSIAGIPLQTGENYIFVTAYDAAGNSTDGAITVTSSTGNGGSLEVTISPPGAVAAGGKWQVDGGTFQSSGATVSNLSVGSHTVSFNTVSGWATPASEIVSVTANSTAATTANYQPSGSLKVTIGPAAAISAGAQWQVDGGTIQNSGATVANLTVGSHTVGFSTIIGWKTPANETISVRSNSTATASGTYLALPGSLNVTISPTTAITDGAKWQVDGGKLQNTGATVTNLSPGNHTVSFNAISGWVTPANQKVSISNNSTTTVNGNYLPQTGSLEVTIAPTAAITVGAQWKVDGGSLQNSGATVTNLVVGSHSVNFNTVSGWTTPSNQTVSIKAKSVATAKGIYIFTAQGIYNGLFYMSAGVSEGTVGMVSSLDVTASGTYSGKLLIGDTTNAISGTFNVFGQASNYVQRTPKQGGPLTLHMTLNWNDSPQDIAGTVSGTNGSPWLANLTAELAANESNSAEYTALVLPAGTPPGYGYMLITNHAGAVTLSGVLADGTSFIQQVPLSGKGDLPVYGNLYGSTGLLLGWIGLESGSPTGNLAWIKQASHSSALYTNGFTNLVSVQGSPWTNPPPHTAALDLPLGQLEISGGSLLSPLSFNVAMSNNNTLVKLAGSPTNSLTGTNNPKTGLLTITFGNGSGKATTVGTGVILQNATNARGFFLGTTNAGGFFLGKTNAGSVNLNVPMLIASELNSPQGLVLNDNYVYFADSSSTDGIIKSVPNSGGSVATLVTGLTTSDGHTPGFVIVNSTIYGGYGGYNAYNMFSAPISGGASTTIASTTDGYFFGVANSIVYYGSGFYYINSVTTSGANATQLASGVWVRGSAVDGIAIYFSDYDTKNVYKYSFASGTITPLITGNSSSDGGLFIDANNVYFNNAGNVLEVSKGGGAVTTLVSSGAAGGYASDGSNVFYLETNAIKSVPVIGGAPSTVVNLGTGGVSSLAVDGSYLYWSDMSGGAGAGKIWRMVKP